MLVVPLMALREQQCERERLSSEAFVLIAISDSYAYDVIGFGKTHNLVNKRIFAWVDT